MKYLPRGRKKEANGSLVYLDIVHCPTCGEETAGTRYCMNCGYPLYKIGKAEKVGKSDTGERTPPVF